MRVGILSVYVDYHRRGGKNRVSLQPQIGPLIAGLLPAGIEVEVINGTWEEPPWDRDYDLLFMSCLHSDFDYARQISHYWRRRGARTVLGGAFASTYPALCQPYFDAIAVGDPEGMVGPIYDDFSRGRLKPRYASAGIGGPQAPIPRFDLMAARSNHPLCFEATRGCPFTCEFCVLTGLGTRFHMRPVSEILRVIEAGQRMLAGRVPAFKRRIVGFCDNNIGGNLRYLRELCQALTPLRIQWYGAVTFNVIANPALVRLMARSGCCALFVGLESFNPGTIEAMHKRQNVVRNMKAAINNCLSEGILIASGLMLSSTTDDLDYIATIPGRLRECGLHTPTFICFETPIPGTPQFVRLAGAAQPAFLPDALLRDFAGYTLVVKPQHAEPSEFVAAYRSLLDGVYSRRSRLRKLAHDLPRFIRRGRWLPAVIDAVDVVTSDLVPLSARTLLAGSDLAPPERVPFDDGDFRSEEERRIIVDPWLVTDGSGRVLDRWRHPGAPFAGARTRAPALWADAATPAMSG